MQSVTPGIAGKRDENVNAFRSGKRKRGWVHGAEDATGTEGEGCSEDGEGTPGARGCSEDGEGRQTVECVLFCKKKTFYVVKNTITFFKNVEGNSETEHKPEGPCVSIPRWQPTANLRVDFQLPLSPALFQGRAAIG